MTCLVRHFFFFSVLQTIHVTYVSFFVSLFFLYIYFTAILKKSLPSGVRFIFALDTGTPLESVDQLQVNEQYVCSSTVHFVRLNYRQLIKTTTTTSQSNHNQVDHQRSVHLKRVKVSNRLFGILSASVQHPSRTKHLSSNGSSLTLSTNGPLSLHSTTSNITNVRSKIVALLRGSCRAAPSLRPPRRAFRFLLNHRIAQNYEQLLNEISACVQLNVGAVHKIYGLSTAKKAISNLISYLSSIYLNVSFFLITRLPV